jgi:hypothetical protein
MTLPRERTPVIWSGPVVEHRASPLQRHREGHLDVLRLWGWSARGAGLNGVR